MMGDFGLVRVLARPLARRRYFARHAERKLHLGCGAKLVPGWLNADKFVWSSDIFVDAYRRLPFPDRSFRIVYAEHLVEHVRIDRVGGLIHEVHRILEDGGLFRFSCPDLELFAARYVAGDRQFFQPILEHFERKRREKPHAKYWVVRSPGSAFMSRAMHFHNHRWMYDFETLRSGLAEVGFGTVLKQRYKESVIPEAGSMDGDERAWESLYVDALKDR